MIKSQKIIFILFAILLFFVPLILWPFTSEVFEFNKMVFVYILTVLIVGAWLARTVLARKIIFRRTILDIPLLIFIGSQFISSVLSIDPLTSWLGYYSRFNGGFLSVICYSLLYWAFVSNFEKKDALKLINYSLLPSAFLVSVYGILEHFGIDKNIWVQDVASRVFSTLGQPNWLAAFLVALLPITWALALEKIQITNIKSQTNSKFKILNSKFLIYTFLSVLFFWTLIFTKSRSGLLGFGVAFLIFWAGYFWLNRKNFIKHLTSFVIIGSSLLVISLISGTQFTPSLYSLLFKTSRALPAEALAKAGPALEVGGTESGAIRKIVWKGAIEVWKNYPIFGTGVETFAFSYYQFRPVEQNLVSEWDFIYNKAHNEYLNMAANSGTVGLLSYLILIGFSLFQIIKLRTNNSNPETINKNLKPGQLSDLSYGFELSVISFALLAGYISLLATNFFGFSVVPTQLELFLFPAIAITLVQSTEYKVRSEKLNKLQKTFIFFLLGTMLYVLFAVGKYWYSDILYAKGKGYNGIQRPDLAAEYLIKAVNLEPAQALYHSELANSYAAIALNYFNQKDTQGSNKYIGLAVSESDKAIGLSAYNVNLKRMRFSIFVMLSTIDPNYLLTAQKILIDAIALAPTDAKLYYNLGLTYARTGQLERAMETLIKAIDLKANYGDARLAYAYLLIDKKRNAEAKEQLEYILKYIDPANSLAKQALDSIR